LVVSTHPSAAESNDPTPPYWPSRGSGGICAAGRTVLPSQRITHGWTDGLSASAENQMLLTETALTESTAAETPEAASWLSWLPGPGGGATSAHAGRRGRAGRAAGAAPAVAAVASTAAASTAAVVLVRMNPS